MPRHDRAYGVWHQSKPKGGSSRRKSRVKRLGKGPVKGSYRRKTELKG